MFGAGLIDGCTCLQYFWASTSNERERAGAEDLESIMRGQGRILLRCDIDATYNLTQAPLADEVPRLDGLQLLE